MKRVLIVLNCGLQLPSDMVRAMQYRPHFERSPHWQATFVSRRSRRLVRLVNRTNRPRIPLMVPLLHRPLKVLMELWERRHETNIVHLAKGFDLVYLIKMSHLQIYQRLQGLSLPKVVMDMNDGLWLPAYQTGEWKSLDAVLAACDAVICENSHVSDYARRHTAHVHVVPDSPQIEVFDRWRAEVQRDPQKVVIGWLGSAENVGALYRILEPLEELFARHPQLHLRIVGADSSMLPRFENVRWSCRPSYNQAIMAQETLSFDIGVFPMFHTGEALARGNLKAMIYMSAEAAVIAERIGENLRLIQEGINGVMASTPQEWLQKLNWLVTHNAERKAIARCGLETVREQFSTPVVFSKLTRTFDQILAE